MLYSGVFCAAVALGGGRGQAFTGWHPDVVSDFSRVEDWKASEHVKSFKHDE